MKNSRNLRALVVDDLRLTRRILIASLTTLGFTDIVEASDGIEAWNEMCQSTRPLDLVIADWHMPNFTGLELLAKIREDERFAKVPFLMFTAEDQPEQVANAVKTGVTAYLTKPLDVDQLTTELKRIALIQT